MTGRVSGAIPFPGRADRLLARRHAPEFHHWTSRRASAHPARRPRPSPGGCAQDLPAHGRQRHRLRRPIARQLAGLRGHPRVVHRSYSSLSSVRPLPLSRLTIRTTSRTVPRVEVLRSGERPTSADDDFASPGQPEPLTRSLHWTTSFNGTHSSLSTLPKLSRRKQ